MLSKKWATLFLTVVLSLLMSCTANIKEYQHTAPAFHLDEFFSGKLMAYAIVLDRHGNLQRRFVADISANWQDGVGIVDEWFTYDDGEMMTRQWRLVKAGDGTYYGTAGDVVGRAEGEESGAAFYWKYPLLITIDNTEYEVMLDDWMFLIVEKRLINKTEISKFGFKVGEVIIFIEKVEPTQIPVEKSL
ncbi:DUF3833 domain-containing protein [Aliivibrio kagoshimensis]|uniref:DUF3833 domain-containing protein n=1 Tax=Aliivibrio kagoshimensis TaxID=2910230 RepID=UPI003D0EAFFB